MIKRLLSLFRPKVQVITFSRKAVKERDAIHSKCRQLAAETRWPGKAVWR